MIHAFIPGMPVPQGSVNAYRGRIVAVTPKLREWRLKIRAGTMARHTGPPLDGPITVHLVFHITPPKRPRWPLPAVKPDLDKLIRAVLDSLSTTRHLAGVITDDARVVSITAQKTYHGRPGVMVTITKSESANESQ
ncbi:RusA family crossover junction endodeoxyribonuclease [Arthrobacter sp. PAMC25564]|uniref:RusA family crossover junction endodeoxyribonuclease n=1 Tax=Arthrobacter sp. PAMC25564 TaxID=2565366 RepID=UPI0010A289B3|nr:RusA family crossover junction endodeoxyribonuclease [Arthrobacter sp. PAMC25564]QCB97132.1 RusA family crossover junction endodeoxyribonuclease [Arthrobacter sp. PAMC25564]